MARSVFMKQSLSPAQIRKEVRDKLGRGLAVEGPFSDIGGSLAKMARELEILVSKGNGRTPLQVTMNALVPLNMTDAALGILDVPFVLGSAFSDGFKGDCAGAVSRGEVLEYEGHRVRSVDAEELNLVAIALLRRLGIESYYSYVHYKNSSPEVAVVRRLAEGAGLDLDMPSPAMMIPEAEGGLVVLMPPTVLPCPSGIPHISAEVLDDDALQSIMRLKLAALNSEALMRDMKIGDQSYPGEWLRRAKDVGHMLHYGMEGWDLREAVMEAAESAKESGEQYLSIRSIAEDRHVRFIADPMMQITSAAHTILCNDAKKEFFYNLNESIGEGEISLSELLHDLGGHRCVESFRGYIDLARLANDHIHAADACDDKDTVN